MNEQLLAHWQRVAAAAGRAAQPDNMSDAAAVLAACSMEDAIRYGRPIPIPTPELNVKLCRAEALAKSA